MPVNDFEKQVRGKMDQFDLVPSPAVWEIVELRVRKEKKRRFLVFWLIGILLAGGTAAGYFIMKENKTNNSIIGNVTNRSNDTQTPETKIINTYSIPSDSSSHFPKNLTETNSTRTEINNHQLQTVKKPKILKIPAEKNEYGAYTISKPNKPKNFPNNAEGKNEKIITSNEKKTEPGIKENQLNKADNASVNEISGVAKVPVTNDSKKADSVLITASVSQKQGKNKRELWLAFAVGRSAIIDKLGFSRQQLVMNSSPLMSSGPSTPLAPRKNYLKEHFSFSAGLGYKKTLSRNLDLNGFLTYQYYSTRMQIGNKIDTPLAVNASQNFVVNQYYRAPGSNAANYTNQYHFFSISGELSWRIIDKPKFKTNWNNGISYSRLIGSSMLHYDSRLGIYYKNNERLNKNQVLFNTSLEFPLSKKVSVNPYATWSLTNAFRKDSANRRYSDYGLQFRILLNKK